MQRARSMTKAPPRATATRRIATAMMRVAGGRMTGPTRRRHTIPGRRQQHHHLHRQLLELLGVASLGGWHRKAWRGRRRRVAGRQLRVRGHRPLRRVLPVLPHHLPALLPSSSSPAFLWDGHRDVLLAPSAPRTSARRSFHPPAVLFHLLRRGTRKGLRAPYLFLVCKPAGTC